MSGDECEVLGRMSHKNLHLGTPVVQSAGTHKRTTAVSPCSSQHDNRFAAWIAIEKANSSEMSQVAPSIFHHLDQLDANILHHGPVHLSHLFGGQVRHFARVNGDYHTQPSFYFQGVNISMVGV